MKIAIAASYNAANIKRLDKFRLLRINTLLILIKSAKKNKVIRKQRIN